MSLLFRHLVSKCLGSAYAYVKQLLSDDILPSSHWTTVLRKSEVRSFIDCISTSSQTPYSRAPRRGDGIVATAMLILNGVRDNHRLVPCIVEDKLLVGALLLLLLRDHQWSHALVWRVGSTFSWPEWTILLSGQLREDRWTHKRNNGSWRGQRMLSISSREAWRVEVADCFLCLSVDQSGFTQCLTVDHFLLINF